MADEIREETEEERRERIRRQRRRREMRRRRRRRKKIIRLVKLILLLAAVILAIVGISAVIRKYRNDKAAAEAAAAQAEEDAKTLTQYSASEVLHLSFPMLTIADDSEEAEETFIDEDGDGIADDISGEELVSDSSAETESVHALTVSEFNDILQQLYDADYVLVDIYSLADSDDSGFSEGTVQVPIGKKPLVVSEYGISYSENDTSHATKLVFSSSGAVTCQYIDSEGNTATGDVDVLPCLETFIASHPDFSYNGARGILGVTGSDGVFGYQVEADSSVVGSLSREAIAAITGTDEEENSADDSSEGTDASEEEESAEDSVYGENASANVTEDGADTASVSSDSGETEETEDAESISSAEIAQNISDAKNLVSVLQQNGWRFASSSYAGISYASSYDLLTADAESWAENAASIVGDTDILLLPFGADIDSWEEYSSENEKYTYLRNLGFCYFCIENEESRTWLQVQSGYVRQGLHEIDSTADFDAVMAL